jgi:hypothetical protein
MIRGCDTGFPLRPEIVYLFVIQVFPTHLDDFIEYGGEHHV